MVSANHGEKAEIIGNINKPINIKKTRQICLQFNILCAIRRFVIKFENKQSNVCDNLSKNDCEQDHMSVLTETWCFAWVLANIGNICMTVVMIALLYITYPYISYELSHAHFLNGLDPTNSIDWEARILRPERLSCSLSDQKKLGFFLKCLSLRPNSDVELFMGLT